MQLSCRRSSGVLVLAGFLAFFIFSWLRLSAPFQGAASEDVKVSKEEVAESPPPPAPAPPPEASANPTANLYTVDTAESQNNNWTIGKQVAVIIETRPLDNLVPLILHFSSVLGPEWPVVLVTSLKTLPNSAPFQRALTEGRIRIQLLPPENQDFASHSSLSIFLTEKWFWERFAPADHVLIFQSDSIICANAQLKVDDFFKYDLVGAPIRQGWGSGYNGGFSLRNRNTVMKIITESSFKLELEAAKKALTGGASLEMTTEYEDQWFYKKMHDLPKKADGQPGANLPTEAVAQTFGVETVWFETPLGYHQVQKFQGDHLDVVEKWCPEYKLTLSKYLPVGEESHG